MVKLTESTYARIAQSIKEYGEWKECTADQCEICENITRTMLTFSSTWWWLCKRHAREVGVLW